MAGELRPRGKKDNSRKSGAGAQRKTQKRIEAEARQAKYAALPMEQKLAGAGAKEKAKLLARIQK